MWLTIDWDPMMYDPEGRAGSSDSEEDLWRYRQMYEDAVGAASGGTLACVTRNSYVPACLEMAIASELVSTGILFHLGKYVFGLGLLTLDVLGGIEHSGWYTRTSPDDVAEIKCEPWCLSCVLERHTDISAVWSRYDTPPPEDNDGSQTDDASSEGDGGDGHGSEEAQVSLAENGVSISVQTII